MSRAGKQAMIAVLLAALTAAVFSSATGNDFVFDDREYLLADKSTVAGLSREGLMRAFTTPSLSLYMPLAGVSLLLDFQLYGKNPSGHHLTNLLLHAANSILIFLALAALTGAVWRSAAVAALCAAHPLRVEPAAWVSGRADLLAALFGLLALLAWERHVRRRGPGWAALAVAALLLGMLSKPIVMTLPFVLLLLDFWPLGRLPVPGRGGGAGAGRTPGIAALLREKAGLFLVAGALVGVALYVLERGTMVVPTERYPPAARVATALVSYATYVGKTLWPAGLTAFYPHRWGSFPPWELGGAVAALACVSAAAFAALPRRPYLATGWLWFLGTLLPVIGLYQARNYPVADRYAYLPQIGLFVMAVWGLADSGRARRHGRGAAAAVVLGLILACVPVSRAQVRHWQNDETLFRHAVSVTRDNWLAHLNFGKALLERGETGRAYAEFVRALEIKPELAEARNNIGIVLIGLKRYGEAAAELEAALRINPFFPKGRNNYGVALASLGRLEEAEAQFRAAIARDPGDDGAFFNLGRTLLERGRREEAVRAFREAARLNPGSPRAREALRALGGTP